MASTRVKPLSDREAKVAKKTVAVGVVPGLTLRVRQNRDQFVRTFVLRARIHGKDTWFTIGSYDLITLAKAREIALDWLKKIAVGIDPLAEKKQKPVSRTVESLMREYVQTEATRGKWQTSTRQTHEAKVDGLIRNHMSKKLREMPVTELTAQFLALEYTEKWLTMRETPIKVIGEIKRAIDWGITLGLVEPMTNPADTHGLLGHLLPAAHKRLKKRHHAYLPPERIPAFVKRLKDTPTASARTLLFSILTCGRINNTLLLTWSQIDFEKKVMTIPRDQMKVKGLSFDRVTPLSDEAIQLIRSMPRFVTEDASRDYVWREFTLASDHISDTSLRHRIKRINADCIKEGVEPFYDPIEVDQAGQHKRPTPHGMSRASFETWANNPKQFKHQAFDADIIEACLDHFSPKYGGAYMRTYPLEDMREILDAWAAFCTSGSR